MDDEAAAANTLDAANQTAEDEKITIRKGHELNDTQAARALSGDGGQSPSDTHIICAAVTNPFNMRAKEN